jgi:hypothetical protein
MKHSAEGEALRVSRLEFPDELTIGKTNPSGTVDAEVN